MTTAAIRQKLQDYIQVADEAKVKAIYTLLQNELEQGDDYWTDEAFIAEIDRRTAEYKEGTVTGIPWSEAKKRILSSNR